MQTRSPPAPEPCQALRGSSGQLRRAGRSPRTGHCTSAPGHHLPRAKGRNPRNIFTQQVLGPAFSSLCRSSSQGTDLRPCPQWLWSSSNVRQAAGGGSAWEDTLTPGCRSQRGHSGEAFWVDCCPPACPVRGRCAWWAGRRCTLHAWGSAAANSARPPWQLGSARDQGTTSSNEGSDDPAPVAPQD